MKKVRRMAVAAATALVVLGVATAPASAAKKITLKSVNARAVSAGKDAKLAKSNANRAIADIGAAVKRLTTAEGTLGALSSAAPQLVTGLQTLGNAVQNELAPGLKKVADALQNQVQPALAQIGETLKTAIPNAIKDVGSNQEYGVTAIAAGAPANTLLPFSVTSGDVPDDGNTATAAGEIPLVSGTGSNGTIPAGVSLSLRSSIRSGENDGATTGDPAGYVGGLLVMTCGAPTCDVDPASPGGDVPAGTIVCAVGPAPAQDIALPDGTTSSQNVVTIQQKVARTDRSVPTLATSAKTVNPLAGITPDASNGPLANDTADGCTMGEGTYLLKVQTQFTDPPTSLSPGIKD